MKSVALCTADYHVDSQCWMASDVLRTSSLLVCDCQRGRARLRISVPSTREGPAPHPETKVSGCGSTLPAGVFKQAGTLMIASLFRSSPTRPCVCAPAPCHQCTYQCACMPRPM
eukprot:364877-Chlamydomonas_euryale.AAC.9